MNFGRIVAWIRKRHRLNVALREQTERFKTCCADSTGATRTCDKARRDILIQSHVVEKGLSHKTLKPLFGVNRVRQLSRALEIYLKKGGRDPYVIGLGMSALKAYNECNRNLGVPSSDLIPIPESGGIPFRNVKVGVRELDKTAFFKASSAVFSTLCKDRHSLRLYDCSSLPISKEILLECISTAQNAPNACNRQGVRISAVRDSGKMRAVLGIHRGSAGFGEHLGALLAVSTDLSLYTVDEGPLALVDAGIFTMNLVYALFEKHLGTCVLNCVLKDREDEKRMRKLLNLPEKEIIAALVAVSDIPDGESVKVACSEKRDVDDIVRFM